MYSITVAVTWRVSYTAFSVYVSRTPLYTSLNLSAQIIVGTRKRWVLMLNLNLEDSWNRRPEGKNAFSSSSELVIA